MTLTDFLLARIAEDEERARDCLVIDVWRTEALNDRVLAECEAKRNVVRIVGNLADRGGIVTARTVPHILRHLALPYANHPDYRQEWKP